MKSTNSQEAFDTIEKPALSWGQTNPAGKEPSPKGKVLMNGKNKRNTPQFAIKDAPKIKTLDLRLAISTPDLGKEITRAFLLAKSSSQELNVFFNHATI
ncbi:MAG: hypothetical protein ABSH11_13495 [Verrucomicrobiota bacterium]|jgi:hypothetical protein